MNKQSNQIKIGKATMQKLLLVAKAYNVSPSKLAGDYIEAFMETELHPEYFVIDADGNPISFLEEAVKIQSKA